MFKYSSSENEIYQSMGQKLSSAQLENKYNFDKLARVIDYLNTASSIFDQTGLHAEAREINGILFSLASKKIYDQLIKIMIESGLPKKDAMFIVNNYDTDRMEGISHKIKEGISIPSVAVHVLERTAEELVEEEGDFDTGSANKIDNLYRVVRAIKNKYKI